MFGGRRRRRGEELAALDRWRRARRLMDEDVTVLGEQVAELHVDTLADGLDPVASSHYQRALEHYDQATQLLARSTTTEDVIAVEQVVADARWHRAAVIAVRDGEPLPERRAPCFFNPQHGPSMRDVEWAPPGGVARAVGVCAADARRLAGGEDPAVRLVRIGDRWVPWHEVGGVAAAIDAARSLADDSYAAHSRGHVAEATARSGLGGANGPAGPYGG